MSVSSSSPPLDLKSSHEIVNYWVEVLEDSHIDLPIDWFLHSLPPSPFTGSYQSHDRLSLLDAPKFVRKGELLSLAKRT